MVDAIEQTTVLDAPVAQVWRAISDSARFDAWFGVALDQPFVAGREALGRIVPTTVDPAVAQLQEPHRGKPWRVWVDQIEPERLFSFRWHPFAIDPARDYGAEPTTLVRFDLAEGAGGTRLTVTETGFDAIPADRRAQALAANAGGWAHQVQLIAQYLLFDRQDRA